MDSAGRPSVIWEHLVHRYDRVPDVGPPGERLRVIEAAAALWPKASTEDLAWIARSLEQLSNLDFLSSLLQDVESAPAGLLEPLIAAAVHAPCGGTQFDRTFTEHAVRFHGAEDTDVALLRHVERGSVDEVQRSTVILTGWTEASPAMKDRRQVVYARRFLADSELGVELWLAELLLFDDGPFPGGEGETIRQALEKAQGHPEEAVRVAADHSLKYAAMLRGMPAWLRPAWEATGDERGKSRAAAARAWPKRDDDAVSWLTAALGVERERLHYFAANMIARASASMGRPDSLRHALVDAAVHERDPSANRVFVEPAVTLFGADAIVSDLLDRMSSGGGDSITGAAQALYWVRGAVTPATAHRRKETHLTCFAAGSPGLQRFLAQLFSIDVERYPSELRPLVEKARELALGHEDEAVRRWARGE